MDQFKASQSVRVTSPQGLHARPADLLAKQANRFEAQIEIIRGCDRVDAKSILAILTLGATQGTELLLEATGPDAEDALRALSELFESEFAESYDDPSNQPSD
jgi:phosphotransferase system HPr (HPr) family protein